MKTEPYKIIKHFRGQYQVLGRNGLDLLGKYVSLNYAQQTVIEYKLQDKALSHPKILRAAECLTALKGEQLHDWLYQFMIRKDAQEMRLYMRNITQFKNAATTYINSNKQARAESRAYYDSL